MRRAATLISVLAGVALVGGACARAGDRQLAREGVQGGPVALSNSCVLTYNPNTLIERSFAFDGTVLSIEVRTDSHLPEGESEVPWVTFEVNRWFRAGSALRIGVWIDSVNLETSAGTIEAEPGTRLLVAGEPRWGGDPLEDPVAWACGFTQPWTPEAAAEWEAAFDSSPKDATPMFTPPATPTSADRNVVEALVSFARSDGRAKANAPPFAPDGVWLGLADRLLVKRSPTELTDPKAWELDGEVFRAYVGPFSALEFLARPEPTIISVGPQPHCASPPVPPPAEVANLRRLSVQPRDRESCLQWWTVDLFLTPEGRISAITVDFFEA